MSVLIYQVVCEQFVGVRDAHAKFAEANDVVVSVIKIRIVAPVIISHLRRTFAVLRSVE